MHLLTKINDHTFKYINQSGQAYPAVSYLMQEGNTTRMYPQALLKQYHDLAEGVDWYEYDMNAYFNSEITWYYEVMIHIFNSLFSQNMFFVNFIRFLIINSFSFSLSLSFLYDNT